MCIRDRKNRKWTESIKLMWFFQSKMLAIGFTLIFVIFFGLNVAIFADDYDRWIRAYQFMMSMFMFGSVLSILIYWRNTKGIPKDEGNHGELISAPILVMTIFMGVASLLGVFHLFYFTSVFRGCDAAVDAENVWEMISDLTLQLSMTVSFVVYPIFIFNMYNRPMAGKWTWLLYMIGTSLLTLFTFISFDEAYHAYVHLCDNTYVLKNQWCPMTIHRHKFECQKDNFTDIQTLWVSMQEQVVGPGSFLVICEYLPLLFALLWMVPTRSEHSQETRSSLAFFEESPRTSSNSNKNNNNNNSKLNFPHRYSIDQMHESGEGDMLEPINENGTSNNNDKLTTAEFSVTISSADGTNGAMPNGTTSENQVVRFRTLSKTTGAILSTKSIGSNTVYAPSTFVQKIAYALAIICSFAAIGRLGFLLNHVGRFPKKEVLWEAVTHTILVVLLCLQYVFVYFGWLWHVKLDLDPNDHEQSHHFAHANFDAFLLRIAAAFCSIQICVGGMAEMNFNDWTGPFFLVHKIPVLGSVWLQYVVVAKALKLGGHHWKLLRKRTSVLLAMSLLFINFMEWVAQFVKRRFTVFVLDSGEPITAYVTVCIAISELLYPALSFYFFHALLCWLTMLWRAVKISPSETLIVTEEKEDEKEDIKMDEDQVDEAGGNTNKMSLELRPSPPMVTTTRLRHHEQRTQIYQRRQESQIGSIIAMFD